MSRQDSLILPNVRPSKIIIYNHRKAVDFRCQCCDELEAKVGVLKLCIGNKNEVIMLCKNCLTKVLN